MCKGAEIITFRGSPETSYSVRKKFQKEEDVTRRLKVSLAGAPGDALVTHKV